MHKYVKYGNNKVIEIYRDEFDKFPVRFGYHRAVKILDNLNAILEFVKIREEEYNTETEKKDFWESRNNIADCPGHCVAQENEK